MREHDDDPRAEAAAREASDRAERDFEEGKYRTLPLLRGNRAGYPPVRGRCPSCRLASLFLGEGGYVTCGNLACADPTSVGRLLDA